MTDPRNSVLGNDPVRIHDALQHRLQQSGEIRRANELELIAIRIALTRHYPNDDYILDRAKYMTVDEIMIREDYISDGPSFCGKVAVIFWGEACFLTVLGDNGTTDTNWEVIDQEV